MSHKLFANPWNDFTFIQNAVFEKIMPAVSSDGWKVLCAALWQTLGGPDSAGVSPGQFGQLTGLSREAAEQAIQECLDAGYLVGTQDGSAYTLNAAFEIQDAEAQVTLSGEQESALASLLAYARECGADADAGQARQAIARNEPAAVLAWIETGRAMTHLAEPERYKTVVSRLLDQIPPLPIHILAPEDEPAPPKAPKPAQVAQNAHELWQAVLDELRPKTKRSLFQWLKPTAGLELANGVLTVGAPNKRTQEWLESGQLADEIRATAESVAGQPLDLVFVVKE